MRVVAGCGSPADPCAGRSGACVSLTVTSPILTTVDTLHLTAFGATKDSSAGKPSPLPIHLALIPPAGASGLQAIHVDAILSGAIVGSGDGSVILGAGRVALTVVVDSGDYDAGVSDSEAGDLAKPDASIADGGSSDGGACGGMTCKLGQTCMTGVCVEVTLTCSSPGITPACAQSTCYSSGQFSISSAGDLVVDVTNGRRLWQRGFQGGADFDTARNFCTSLTLDGVTSGWRLPSYAELATILLHPGGLMGCPTCDPAIDQAAFPGVPSGSTFWTTDPYMPGTYQTVDFCDGRKNYPADVTSSEPFRCVHDPLP